MKVNIEEEKNMDRECTLGQTVITMMVDGRTT